MSLRNFKEDNHRLLSKVKEMVRTLANTSKRQFGSISKALMALKRACVDLLERLQDNIKGTQTSEGTKGKQFPSQISG